MKMMNTQQKLPQFDKSMMEKFMKDMPQPPGGMPQLPKDCKGGGDFKFPKMDPNMASLFSGRGPGGPVNCMQKGTDL